MRRDVTIGVILIAAMASGGCVVSKGLYDQSVMEKESAKADLERVQTQKNALEQEVKGLWNQNEDLAVDVELAKAELQRIKDRRDKERVTTEGRLRELVERTKGLSTHYRTLYKAHERLKKRNKALNKMVARYKKELKKHPQAVAQARPPAVITPPTAPQPPARPKVGSAGQTSQPGLAPINVNKASANDMVLFLGLTKEVADKVVENRPYRIKGELVARNVVPKITFDAIKDRISVAQ